MNPDTHKVPLVDPQEAATLVNALIEGSERHEPARSSSVITTGTIATASPRPHARKADEGSVSDELSTDDYVPERTSNRLIQRRQQEATKRKRDVGLRSASTEPSPAKRPRAEEPSQSQAAPPHDHVAAALPRKEQAAEKQKQSGPTGGSHYRGNRHARESHGTAAEKPAEELRPILSTHGLAGMSNVPHAFASPNIQFMMRQYAYSGAPGPESTVPWMSTYGVNAWQTFAVPLPLPIASPSPTPNTLVSFPAPFTQQVQTAATSGSAPADLGHPHETPVLTEGMGVSGSDDSAPKSALSVHSTVPNAFPAPTPGGATPGLSQHPISLTSFNAQLPVPTPLPMLNRGFDTLGSIGPGLLTQMMSNDAFTVNTFPPVGKDAPEQHPPADLPVQLLSPKAVGGGNGNANSDKGKPAQSPPNGNTNPQLKQSPTSAFKRASGGSDSLSPADVADPAFSQKPARFRADQQVQ
jgi:hypothetical protein